MATIEFLNKRIEGKRKEIAKLEKKLERINKAKESNWEKNPYYYHESDLKYTTRDLESAREALAKYISDLENEQEKANSRNVPAILEFLEHWKDMCREFYESMLPKYIEARDEWYRYSHEHADWWNNGGRRNATPEERKKVDREYRETEEAFRSKWNFITPYITGYKESTALDWDRINKDLNVEADRKYDFIIERTNAIVGEITDASGLYVGNKGDLNGYILGTRGRAHVQTIGAGGYNIQCFHFRTLINKA